MKKHQSGFSLIEVMIVVAIIAIIAAVALPSYNDSVNKGRRSDGQASLLDTASKMESYFYTNKTYTDDMTNLGFSADPAGSSEGHYTIEISSPSTACPITSCYQLKATAVGAQASDGDLTLSSNGVKLPAEKW